MPPLTLGIPLTASMMSISPVRGHGTPWYTSEPMVQNAGHRPWPAGSRILASLRPYLTAVRLIRRADV